MHECTTYADVRWVNGREIQTEQARAADVHFACIPIPEKNRAHIDPVSCTMLSPSGKQPSWAKLARLVAECTLVRLGTVIRGRETANYRNDVKSNRSSKKYPGRCKAVSE